MVDIHRRGPAPPWAGPEIEFKPGMAREMLRDLAPLLAIARPLPAVPRCDPLWIARCARAGSPPVIAGTSCPGSSPATPDPPAPPQSIPQLVSTAVNLGWIVDKTHRLASGESIADDLPALKFKDAAQVFYWQIESAIAEFGVPLNREIVTTRARMLLCTRHGSSRERCSRCYQLSLSPPSRRCACGCPKYAHCP
jgi:hypothetical protein